MKFSKINLLILLSSANLFAQAPDILWTKTFGGDSNDVGYCAQQTIDYGYIIVGETRSFGAIDSDLWLIRTDANGDTLWTKIYGGDSSDTGVAVHQTFDDGFIITGSTSSFGAGKSDVWLIKTDANGNSMWSKTFGGISNDHGFSVEQTADGGYTVAGLTESFGASGDDVWLIRTDAYGDTLWTKTFGDSVNIEYHSVQQTKDGGYIIVLQGSKYIWLIKTNPNGDTLWTKTYWERTFGTSYTYYKVGEIQQTADNGYIMIGTDSDNWVGASHPLVIKTNVNGDTLWTKTLAVEPATHGNLIQQTSDGGYVILGPRYCTLPTCGYIEDFLIKTDANGDTLWTKKTSDVGWRNVRQTNDGSYIITGYFLSEIDSVLQRDVLLIKMAQDLTSIEQNPNSSINGYQLKQNYPNPFNPVTTIEFDLPNTSEVILKFFNILGEEVATLVSDRLSAGSYSYEWGASNLASGVYFYRLKAGDPSSSAGHSYVQTRKMILMR